MKIRITKKYLTIPVSSLAVSKKLLFYAPESEGEKLVFDLDCRIDLLNPDFTAYVDVSRFAGQELDVRTDPDLPLCPGTADEIAEEGLYREELRPFSHFTVKLGWNNDPNGLVLYRGTYHMFYQYNPMAAAWGNMHWGHAVSTDLVHWEEKDIALFPDETGTMYSGSAIEDKDDLTGLGKDGVPPLLLYYTAAGGRNLLSGDRGRVQCLAYSDDGGQTFKKHGAVVPSMAYYNRDPKVVWVEELSRYIMGLYLSGTTYALLTSENLADWEKLQEISVEGESECPDLCPFTLNGQKYWALLGASDKYVIGRFDGGAFVPLTSVKQIGPTDQNKNYAAQSFSGIADGRGLRMYWERVHIPAVRFTNQMSVPVELRLAGTPEDLYLTAVPAAETEQLRDKEVRPVFSDDGRFVTCPLERAAYDVTLSAETRQELRLEFFGAVLKISADGSILWKDKVVSPAAEGEKIEVRLILDRGSAELFTCGRYFSTLPILCDYNLPYLRLTRKDAPAQGALRLRELTCFRLRSIH